MSGQTANKSIGFVGAGAMGAPMIGCLVRGGYQVDVWDLAAERAADAADRYGCRALADPRDLGASAVIVFMLPDGDAVHDVLFGGRSLAGVLAVGTTVIDMSSSAPQTTLATAGQLAAAGVDLVDAPVSGGVGRAKTGELTAMVGATTEQYERCRPLLSTMASSVVHVGPVGSGHALKALNNLMSATGLAIALEALEAARSYGIADEQFLQVVNQSTGANHATQNKLQRYVFSGSFDSGFAMRLMVKDLGIARGLIDGNLLSEYQLSGRVIDVWRAALRDLDTGADHTDIARAIHSAWRAPRNE
jgi:3-hydroxyisobutyrate dehydrogenase